MPQDPLLKDFIAVSAALTGVDPLDSLLAEQYLARCNANPNVGPWLPQLIAVFNDIVAQNSGAGAIKTKIMNDPTLGAVAEQIIYLWYVSAFFQKDAPGAATGKWIYSKDHPEHYDKALVWSIIGAHPPMTDPKDSDPQKTYGYWGHHP